MNSSKLIAIKTFTYYLVFLNSFSTTCLITKKTIKPLKKNNCCIHTLRKYQLHCTKSFSLNSNLEWKLFFANQTNFHVPSKALPCRTLLWAKITWILRLLFRLLFLMNPRNVLIHVTFATKFGWANSTSIGFLLFMNLDDVPFQLAL